jgi:hypothetical protein
VIPRKRLALVSATAALTFSLIGGASAQGATQTVTLGSLLGSNLSPTPINSVVTISQNSLPGATLVAPFNGTITSWKVIGASGTWNLRVVNPLGGNLFTGAGIASSGPIPNTGVQTFQANLPIKAGQMIGLDSTVIGDTLGVSASGTPPGAAFIGWGPPLVDNAPGRAPNSGAPRELGFNATVVSNCIVPKVKGNKKKAAKKKIRKAGCSPGKVKKRKGAGKGAKVKKQNPKAGTEVPAGTPVNLKLR